MSVAIVRSIYKPKPKKQTGNWFSTMKLYTYNRESDLHYINSWGGLSGRAWAETFVRRAATGRNTTEDSE